MSRGRELIVETFYSTEDKAWAHAQQYDNKPEYIVLVDTIRIN